MIGEKSYSSSISKFFPIWIVFNLLSSAIFTVIEHDDKIRLITRNNGGRHCWDISTAEVEAQDEELEEVVHPDIPEGTNPITRAEISGHLNDQLWLAEANQAQLIENTTLPKCDAPLEVIRPSTSRNIQYHSTYFI